LEIVGFLIAESLFVQLIEIECIVTIIEISDLFYKGVLVPGNFGLAYESGNIVRATKSPRVVQKYE